MKCRVGRGAKANGSFRQTWVSHESRLIFKGWALLTALLCQHLCQAQSDGTIEQNLKKGLPASTKLLNFTRVAGAQLGLVVLSKPGEVLTSQGEARDGELVVLLIKTQAQQIVPVGKPINLYFDLVKPKVIRLDADQDGSLEVAVVCNAGGAHAMECISVLKATPSGPRNLCADLPLAYGWKVLRKSKAGGPVLMGETSDGKPLNFVYDSRRNRFVRTKASGHR